MAAKKKAQSIRKKSTRKKSKGNKVLKKTSKDFLQLNNQVWPLERNVLFRPERFKYVRKLLQPTTCVFCTAAEKDQTLETLCIYKSKHSMIVLNKYPYNSGHLLVLPRVHQGDLSVLAEESYLDLMLTLRKAIKAVTEIYKPIGFNLGLNHGAVSGAGIPDHLHFHIVPRWAGDLNFFPLIAETKVVIENLEQSFEKYLNYFSQIAE